MNPLQSRYFGSTPYDQRRSWILEERDVREGESRILSGLMARIDELPATARVLEVGCGAGTNLALIQHTGRGGELLGIDPCPEAIDSAKKAGLPVVLGDGFTLPFADASFEVVFCRDVLHHLATPDERRAFLAEMERVAKREAYIFAIEPNVLHPLIFLQQLTQPAEREVRNIREKDLLALFPARASVQVVRHEPSLLWRVIYHYRMPSWVKRCLRTGFVCTLLRTWQRVVARYVPSAFWAYRTYSWKRV